MMALDAPADYRRRREHFLGDHKSSADPILNDLPDIAPSRVDASDPLEQAATGLVRSSLESHALSMQMPLVGADMDRMLSAAQYLLRGMPRHQLAGLSPSSSIMQSLTSASFSIAMAPDMQQRVMRMAHEKAALASQAAAVEEQARTGGVVAFGYQRPGGRARNDDGTDARSGASRSSLGGLGGVGSDASSIRFAGLGNERVTPAVARVMQQASYEAVRSGIPWAAAKPDLLMQGPAGVKAIADVQIKEPTYQRLTTQAHFIAKEVVTLATFAKVKGIADANPLAHATADVVQIGRTIPEQINTKNAITGYMAASTAAATKPNDPAAQAALEKAGMHQRGTLIPIAASSPENYTKVQSYEDKAKVEKRFRATMTEIEAKAELAKTQAVQAETTAAAMRSAAAQKATASDTMFGLPSIPTAGSGAPPTVPAPLPNAAGAATAMLPNPALSAQPTTPVAAAMPSTALVPAPVTLPVTGPQEAPAANSARPDASSSDTTAPAAAAGVATTSAPTTSSATGPAQVVALTASPPSASGQDAATPTVIAAQSVPSPSTQVAAGTAPAVPAPAAPAATAAAMPVKDVPAAPAPAVQTASAAPPPKPAAGPKPG